MNTFYIPQQLQKYVSLNSENELDITKSVEDFLARWTGNTENNRTRRYFFKKTLKELENLNYNFINARGDGSCYYECIFMFLKLIYGTSFNKENPEEFKKEILDMINCNCELREIYGEAFDSIIEPLKDQSCPDIEIPMAQICNAYNLNACIISYEDTGNKVYKYFSDKKDEDTENISIILSDHHYYLLFPTSLTGSTSLLRQIVNSSIDT